MTRVSTNWGNEIITTAQQQQIVDRFTENKQAALAEAQKLALQFVLTGDMEFHQRALVLERDSVIWGVALRTFTDFVANYCPDQHPSANNPLDTRINSL